MADLHFIPRDPVKSVPDNYPKPKCDPKKTIIHLPPAAYKPTLDEDLSHTFRSPTGPLPKPAYSEPTTSSDEEDDRSLRDDRSGSSSPPLPYARPSPLPYARPSTSLPQQQPPTSLPGPVSFVRPDHGCAHTARPTVPPAPATRSSPSPAARPYVRPAQSNPVQIPVADEKGPYPQRGYTASQTVRGSTVPRHVQKNGMCSPAANMGRGNPYAVNKVLRSPPKN